MHIFAKQDYGAVCSFELGYSVIGKPLLTTRIYFVDNILIDTGLNHCRGRVLDLVRENPVSAIYLTHYHEDHSGNAFALRQAFGIPILGHTVTVEKMKSARPIFPYQRYFWGVAPPVEMEVVPDKIETKSYVFHPIHTPGHSRDHLVFWEPSQGWLFSGDLYLGDKIRYFRADEVLQDQVHSLRKILKLDFEALFCTHNPRSVKGKNHLKMKLENFENLIGEVGLLRNKGFSSKDILKELEMKEAYLLKLFCFGNVSRLNLIRSAAQAASAV